MGLDFAIDDKQASGTYSIQWPNNTSTYQTPYNWQKGILSGSSIHTGITQLSERENTEIMYFARNNGLIIDSYSLSNRNAELGIYSVMGYRIAKKRISFNKGYQQEWISLPHDITCGVYIIRLGVNDGSVILKKIVVTN